MQVYPGSIKGQTLNQFVTACCIFFALFVHLLITRQITFRSPLLSELRVATSTVLNDSTKFRLSPIMTIRFDSRIFDIRFRLIQKLPKPDHVFTTLHKRCFVPKISAID